jgi:hypothetical protein
MNLKAILVLLIATMFSTLSQAGKIDLLEYYSYEGLENSCLAAGSSWRVDLNLTAQDLYKKEPGLKPEDGYWNHRYYVCSQDKPNLQTYWVFHPWKKGELKDLANTWSNLVNDGYICADYKFQGINVTDWYEHIYIDLSKYKFSSKASSTLEGFDKRFIQFYKVEETPDENLTKNLFWSDKKNYTLVHNVSKLISWQRNYEYPMQKMFLLDGVKIKQCSTIIADWKNQKY